MIRFRKIKAFGETFSRLFSLAGGSGNRYGIQTANRSPDGGSGLLFPGKRQTDGKNDKGSSAERRSGKTSKISGTVRTLHAELNNSAFPKETLNNAPPRSGSAIKHNQINGVSRMLSR